MTDQAPPQDNSRLRDIVAHTMVDFTQMKSFIDDPLILASADRITVSDTSGRSYIDGVSGVFTMSLGYSANAVADAISAQLRRLPFSSPVSSVNDKALELIDRLIGLAGHRYNLVKLFTTGSEAIEAAIRFSRQYHKQSGQPGRYKVIGLYRGFHGATLGALSATGWARMRVPYEPLAGGFLHVRPPICGRTLASHDHEHCGRQSAEELRDAILGEGPETVAAVILEPVMSSAGVHVLPTAYLESLRRTCDELGVLLIYDEIITGFGRTGTWFAAEHSGVWPDLLCIGKGLSAGYAPLSAVLMTERVGSAFWGEPDDNRQFQSGHTFAGNPVSAAAGLAVIDAIQESNVLDNTARAGTHLAARMSALNEGSAVVREVRGIGLLCGVEFYPPNSAHAAAGVRQPIGRAVGMSAKHRGLLVRPWLHGDGLTVAPPLITTIAEIDAIADILEASVADATG